jgi:hypothetical protein
MSPGVGSFRFFLQGEIVAPAGKIRLTHAMGNEANSAFFDVIAQPAGQSLLSEVTRG